MKPAPPVTSTGSPASGALTCPRSIDAAATHSPTGPAPRRCAIHAQLAQLLGVLVGVHRPPEAVVVVRVQLPAVGETREHLALEIVAYPQIEHPPIEHEKPGVDAMIGRPRFLAHPIHPATGLDVHRPVR